MGKIIGVDQNPNGTHADRCPPAAKWGDNSIARPTTQAYRDNFDRIFRKKDKDSKDK